MLGGLIGEFLIGVLGSLLFSPNPPDRSLIFTCLVGAVLLGAIGLLLWFPVSLTQGLVLRWIIPHFDQAAFNRWVLTSAVAAGGALILGGPLFILFMAIVYGLSYSSHYLIFEWSVILLYLAFMGLVLGTVFGLSQSVLLRRYVNTPGWWLVGTLLAWGVAVPVNFLLLDRLLYPMISFFTLASPIHGALSGFDLKEVLGGVLLITLTAVITGLTVPSLRQTATPDRPVAPPPWRRFALPRLRPVHPDLPRTFRE
jgi:hypothetical protein